MDFGPGTRDSLVEECNKVKGTLPRPITTEQTSALRQINPGQIWTGLTTDDAYVYPIQHDLPIHLEETTSDLGPLFSVTTSWNVWLLESTIFGRKVTSIPTCLLVCHTVLDFLP